MKAAQLLAALAVASPLVAAAQTSYSHAVITGEPRYVVKSLGVCERRNDALWDRKALIEEDRSALAREDASIAALRSEIEQERRNLDARDHVAVAAYNAKSETLNRWVDTHNRRVDELNGAAALLNADTRDLLAYCDNLYAAR